MFLESLTSDVRAHALSELSQDQAAGRVYISPRLRPGAGVRYRSALKMALESGSPTTLAAAIRDQGLLNTHETSSRNGKSFSKRVPSNAADTLAQGEFNRYYIRGVCLYAIQTGQQTVEVYRARDSSWQRAESEALVGTRIPAADLLHDLRSNIGAEPTLLPQVNSGLSVRLLAN